MTERFGMSGDGKEACARLHAALDTFGADRTRWPADLRRDLSALIAREPEARRLLSEAAIFDRLLDIAPSYPAARLESLTDRITQAARRSPRRASVEKNPAARFNSRLSAGALTALAASLMLGVFAGTTQFATPAIENLAAVSGFDDVLSPQLARTDESDGFIDEDLI